MPRLDSTQKIWKSQGITYARTVPVQNVWLTVVDITQTCRLRNFSFTMETAGETIEVKITRDGTAYTLTQVAVADTAYQLQRFGSVSSSDLSISSTNDDYLDEQCSTLKIEIRKTTAAAANNLARRTKYDLLLIP